MITWAAPACWAGLWREGFSVVGCTSLGLTCGGRTHHSNVLPDVRPEPWQSISLPHSCVMASRYSLQLDPRFNMTLESYSEAPKRIRKLQPQIHPLSGSLHNLIVH